LFKTSCADILNLNHILPFLRNVLSVWTVLIIHGLHVLGLEPVLVHVLDVKWDLREQGESFAHGGFT
jgi:hypothetical protein